MLRFNAELLNKDLKKFKDVFEEGLKEVIRTFVQDVVEEIAYNTPIGNAQDQLGLYRLRNKYNNRLQPKEGLAANNWRVSTSSAATGIVQKYGNPTASIGVDAYNKLSTYKLGQTVYIVNNAPHIEQVLTGNYYLPIGNGNFKLITKEALGPKLLGIVQTGYKTFNEEVGKLNIKLKGL